MTKQEAFRDFAISRIMLTIAHLSGREEMTYPADIKEYEREITEIRQWLTGLSENSLGLVLMVMHSGVSYECECGRIIDVSGDRTVTVNGKKV